MNNIYALEAFLEMFRGKDVFSHMKESDSPLLQRFISWDSKIDLAIFDDVAYNPTVECVLGWIVELYNEKIKRLNLTSDSNNRKLLSYYVRKGSVNATVLWLNTNPDDINYTFVLIIAMENGNHEVVKLLLADHRVNTMKFAPEPWPSHNVSVNDVTFTLHPELEYPNGGHVNWSRITNPVTFTLTPTSYQPSGHCKNFYLK